MKSLKAFLVFVALFSFTAAVFGFGEEPEENRLERAQRYMPGVASVELDAKSGRVLQLKGPMSTDLDILNPDAVREYMSERSRAFGLDRKDNDFQVTRQNEDRLGMQHARLQHLYKGVEVFGSELLLHGSDGILSSINGQVVENLDLDVRPVITAEQALRIAMQHSGGTLFRWQVEFEERLLKELYKDRSRTWKPEPKLVIAPKDGNFSGDDYRLAYNLILPIERPQSENLRYFIDAGNGEIVATWSRTPDADVTGSGTGIYHGNVTFQTNSSGSIFQLYDINRDVLTYDGQSGTSVPGVLFTDSNNIWNSSNQAAGVDAHWAAGHTYDYLTTVLGRNSLDDNGMNMISTVHYSNNWNNAQWIGTQARFGDGDGSTFGPLVEMDIVAHEFAHGVTQFTSNLVYQGESGALNEAYSDMLGAQVEFFADPGNADWFIGENSFTPGTPGDALRYMFNPNLGNHPDTYQGTFWASTTGPDNGGVHTNSGVANFQFYLLTEGGSGTNDNGAAYSVSGIGIDAASQIWYRAQTTYFGVNTQYAGARVGTVSAAEDLYGASSNEVDQVENAWHAVGVGLPAGVTVVGNTTVFGSTTTTANRRAMPFTMPETGTINSITMYHEGGSGNLILAVYDGTTLPGNRLATTASTPINGSAGWQTINLTNGVNIAGGTQIWLAWVFQNNPGIRYQSGTPGRADAGTGWAGGMPDPFGSSTQANFIYSIYAAYTPGGGGNQSPTAEANGPYSGTINNAVNFSSAGSNDPDGSIVSYLWDFGDGNTSASANPSHTYTSAGTFNVQLTVEDNDGATDTDQATATITDPGSEQTVGNTTIFASTSTSGNRRAMPFTMPESGTINSITMYHEAGSGDMILAVYDGATLPANRLATTAATPVSGSAGWQTINLTNSVNVTGGTQIWLAWVYESNPGIRYQSGSPGRADAGAGWSGGMPDPYGSSTQANFIYSIYASYTPGGSGGGNVGNTSIFASTSTSGNRRAMPFTMPETGTINSVTMYHEAGSGDMILAVYDGASSPNNLLASTPATAVSGTAGWQTINLTTPVNVSGGTQIWLAWVYESNPGIRYQSGSPGRADAGVGWSGGMPNPYGSSTQANFLYSIYATYTTSSLAKSIDSPASLTTAPKTFALHNAYPNPFNPETNLSFDLPKAERVDLQVYNSLGQLVQTLLNDVQHPAGSFIYRWDGRNQAGIVVPSGPYFIRLKAGHHIAVQRVMMLK